MLERNGLSNVRFRLTAYRIPVKLSFNVGTFLDIFVDSSMQFSVVKFDWRIYLISLDLVTSRHPSTSSQIIMLPLIKWPIVCGWNQQKVRKSKISQLDLIG